MKIPPALNRILVVVSAFLSILGLSSIVDGFVTWVGFFRRILDVYQDNVRDPIAQALNWVLPDTIQLPVFAIDIFMIWTTCFAVFRLFVSLEKRHSIIFGYLRKTWFFYPMALALGPFLPLYFRYWTSMRISYEKRTAEEELRTGTLVNGGQRLSEAGKIAIRKRLEATEEWLEDAKKVHQTFAIYYGAAIATFVLILFINYQVEIMG